jgi:hypothetical protein
MSGFPAIVSIIDGLTNRRFDAKTIESCIHGISLRIVCQTPTSLPLF